MVFSADNKVHPEQVGATDAPSNKTSEDAFSHQHSIKYVDVIADHPKTALPFACCFCFPFCALLNLIAFVVSGGTYFSVSMPFYVKGHIKYKRQDSLKQARHDTVAVPPQFARTAGFGQREINAFEIRILYEAPTGSNIFDKKYIMKIAEIESKLLAAKGKNSAKDEKTYSDYCQIMYRKHGNESVITNPADPCRNPMSVVGLLSTSWLPLPYNINTGTSTVKPALWANHSDPDLRKCEVVPKHKTWSWFQAISGKQNISDGDLFLGDMLPRSVHPDRFKQVLMSNDQTKICNIGKEVMPRLTCGEFLSCLPLMYNLCMMVGYWGYTHNKMYDMKNLDSSYGANIKTMVDYWSKYNASVRPAPQNRGALFQPDNIAPYVIGFVVDRGSTGYRQLAPSLLPNAARAIVDSSFGYPAGAGAKTGKAVMSRMYFGSPASNINAKWVTVPNNDDCNPNSGQCKEEADITKWMFNSFHDILWEYTDKEKTDGLIISWQLWDVLNSDEPLKNLYTTSKIPGDMRFLAGAVLFVWAYIIFMKRSVFLATFAIIMIFGSALPTIVLYQLIFQQRFMGILNLLSMFIIMGIGADDVFVLLDCYEADRDRANNPLRVDLSHAWKHASKAMLVTSSTTFFSFMSNATSIFPAIQTFGLWCSCLIVVNFFHVNFFYLAVTSMYDAFFEKRTMICCGMKEKPLPEPPLHDSGNGHKFEGPSAFFADKYFPCINRFRIPLVLLWVFLFFFYAGAASQIKPDPKPPTVLPEDDPYEMFNPKMVKHFGAILNPYRIKVQLAGGIDADDPIDRTGTEAVKTQDRGKVNFIDLSSQSDAETRQFQEWLTDDAPNGLCPTLRNTSIRDSSLRIARREDLNGQDPVSCPWTHLKTYVKSKDPNAWPRPNMSALQDSIMQHMGDSYTEDPSKTNFEALWKNRVYFTKGKLAIKWYSIEVMLAAETLMDYKEGNKLGDAWQKFVDSWTAKAPDFIKKGFFYTDKAAFHYFVVQQTIIKECFQGIGISLFLAGIVLVIATGNIVVAAAALISITSIVCSCIAFAVCVGWKLGLMEAVIFVMVIGMSVDYVVHMADAYLETPDEEGTDRSSRTRFMVGKMGISVVSGAVTTLGSSFLMTFTYIRFFKKFGIMICWTIFQSVIVAMVFFTALMALVGPQGTFGNIPIGRLFSFCRGRSEKGDCLTVVVGAHGKDKVYKANETEKSQSAQADLEEVKT